MLDALVRYYERESNSHPDLLPPIGWSVTRVGYCAQISEAGDLVTIVPLADKGQVSRIVPSPVKRTSTVAANFLCDKSAYLFGVDDKGDSTRNARCFEASRELHRAILQDVDCPCARAVIAFFDKGPYAKDDPVIAAAGDTLLKGGNIVFMVESGGELVDPLTAPEVRRAWEDHSRGLSDAADMRCLVTGELAPVARLHPSIKGVVGAKSSGASLVSFNARSFESYGHDEEQGRNAPVSEYAAQAYAAALNHLLSTPSHNLRLGDMTVVYWSERSDTVNSDFFSLCLGNAQPVTGGNYKENADKVVDATLRDLVRGVYRDIEGIDLDATFYVLGLAPSDARLAVKFYYRDSFGNMLENLRKHYARTDVCHGKKERAYLTPYWLLRSIERETGKKAKSSSKGTPRNKHTFMSLLGESLLKAMISDSPYPQPLYTNALMRVHSTQEDPDEYVYKVSRGRASIIRAYLIRNCEKEGYGDKELTVSLNEDRKETAYCLGRAFAILEQIQELANGRATITNRYFNSASTTPSTVFPTLIRLSKAHLAKVGRTKRGLAITLERQLQDVLDVDRVERFPGRLTLEQQGDFMLGYFHQRNRRFEGKQNDSAVQDSEEE